jgi:hypothetical protein
MRFLPKRKPVGRAERSKTAKGIGKNPSGSASRKFRSKLLRRRVLRSILMVLGVVLFLALLIGGGIFSVNYVIDLRSESSADDIVQKSGFVVGFDDVPAFPGAEFIFDDYSSNETVRQFLSNGNSVYRLPPNVSSENVNDYYSEAMLGYEWELANSVPFESEEMMPGQYWVKGDKGIRIYSKFNDIWYETVSVKQANNGLKDEVKKETERKLLLLTSSYTDLLPDFPWRLKVPSEFLVSYTGTDLTDLQAVSFKQIGHSNTVTLTPVGYIGAVDYDSFLNSYLDKVQDGKWSVINSVVTTVSEQEAIRASITDGSKLGEGVVVGNPRNSVAYVLVTYEEDDPFFQYVIENIVPAKSSY